MSEPFCEKCLIEKIDPLGILETIREKVEMIPEDEKTTDEDYVKRLEICSECKELNLGTCVICDCFVEYRAAHTNMHCPSTDSKW